MAKIISIEDITSVFLLKVIGWIFHLISIGIGVMSQRPGLVRPANAEYTTLLLFQEHFASTYGGRLHTEELQKAFVSLSAICLICTSILMILKFIGYCRPNRPGFIDHLIYPSVGCIMTGAWICLLYATVELNDAHRLPRSSLGNMSISMWEQAMNSNTSGANYNWRKDWNHDLRTSAMILTFFTAAIYLVAACHITGGGGYEDDDGNSDAVRRYLSRNPSPRKKGKKLSLLEKILPQPHTRRRVSLMSAMSRHPSSMKDKTGMGKKSSSFYDSLLSGAFPTLRTTIPLKNKSDSQPEIVRSRSAHESLSAGGKKTPSHPSVQLAPTQSPNDPDIHYEQSTPTKTTSKGKMGAKGKRSKPDSSRKSQIKEKRESEKRIHQEEG